MPTDPPIPTPASPAYFDYVQASIRAKVSSSDLARIVRVFEADYPRDLMLRELHVLRACNAIARGGATVESIVGASERAA